MKAYFGKTFYLILGIMLKDFERTVDLLLHHVHYDGDKQMIMVTLQLNTSVHKPSIRPPYKTIKLHEFLKYHTKHDQ
jgi:hypothetical protein